MSKVYANGRSLSVPTTGFDSVGEWLESLGFNLTTYILVDSGSESEIDFDSGLDEMPAVARLVVQNAKGNDTVDLNCIDRGTSRTVTVAVGTSLRSAVAQLGYNPALFEATVILRDGTAPMAWEATLRENTTVQIRPVNAKGNDLA